MVIDLHKCGNGYKKICKQLNIQLSTARAIINKIYRTVELASSTHEVFILPLRILRRIVREATKSLRITVKE